MAEENLPSESENTDASGAAAPSVAAPLKKKGWFSKIPKDILLSPGGMILIFFALVMEILDWIPIPFIDQLWELPMELIFIFLLIIIAKVPIKTCFIPFIIERIPAINDILPTWILRLFM